MTWMLYGANGYTGQLIAEEAVRRGHRPLLAGRSAEKLAKVAKRLSLDHEVIDLTAEPGKLQKVVNDVDLVLHAAGPFIHTSAPMVQACLAGNAHYLDITGEFRVFEQVFARDADAQAAGIALIPGVGYDVIPTDCLAKYVADFMSGAVELEIAMDAIATPSGGTFKSLLEIIKDGGYLRRDGKLISQRLGKGTRTINFSHGTFTAIPVPLGDLISAYHATGIPNITTYMTNKTLRRVRSLLPISGLFLSNAALRQRIGSIGEKFTAAKAGKGRSYLWARVLDSHGKSVEARMEVAEGYEFTYLAAVRAVEKVLEKKPKGALSPAQALGVDFILDIPGTVRSAVEQYT